jgi:predicted DNA-binding protein
LKYTQFIQEKQKTEATDQKRQKKTFLLKAIELKYRENCYYYYFSNTLARLSNGSSKILIALQILFVLML